MIPFSPPRIDQQIIDEVIDTLKSGWITTGPKTKLFEKKITEFCNCRTVLALSSATSGLELILRWFGVKQGDEVILPAYTYAATANVIIHCGATPIFVDINHDDFNISISKVEEAITSRTKVIMPVDFAGFPCDYEALNNLVINATIGSKFIPNSDIQKKLGRILILSDAAHSLGAYTNNGKTGVLTDITVFSFHAVKNLTTAEGGAIAFNLPNRFNHTELYTYFNTLILHGQDKDAAAKTKKGNWEYDIKLAGYKANMTDISASIGLVELSRYENDTLIRRRKIIETYISELEKYEWAEIPIYRQLGKVSSYHLFPLRIIGINENQRNKIIESIFNKEVSVNVHFKPLPMMSFYKKLGYNIGDYPTAYDSYAREISLPVYYDLSDSDVKIIIKVLIDSVKSIIEQK